MKVFHPIVVAVLALLVLPEHQSSAFSPVGCCSSSSSSLTPTLRKKDSETALSMGLLDIFSKEAREERERKKKMVIEEQERLQKEIMERRRNPEKMEEYEIKTQMRRELRMEGRDAEALKVAETMYEGADQQTLLNGSRGGAEN